MVEFNSIEAESFMRIFRSARFERFFPEKFGDESAHEAMDAVRKICAELFINAEGLEDDEFYSLSFLLTPGQFNELLRFANEIIIDDVISWGYSNRIAKYGIVAIWRIKEGLMSSAMKGSR